jgi:TetR/AcrR family transcriptional regulator, repressor of fatR-cypB operon
VKRRDEGKARDILAATLQEIEATGLAGLAMEAVARRAGVATGTVYIYFKGKEALLDALYAECKRDFGAMVAPEPGLPVRADFSRVCAGILTYLIEHRAEMSFILQMTGSPDLTEETRSVSASSSQAIIEVLERGKREKVLKDLDTSFMRAFLQGALRELAEVAAREPPARRAAAFEQITTLCWDALKA